MTSISIPNDWTPRHYQLPVLQAFADGIKRFVLIYHRRAGKDSLCVNIMAISAMQRPGNYLYLFPTQVQARKALWDAVDRNGRRVIDQAFPAAIRDTVRNDQMFMRLKNGSTIQVSGADNSDALVGTNYVGVVFSEYAITSPSTWRYINPIVSENNGWVIFNSTPRGKNHLHALYATNKTNPLWYTQVASVTDTHAIPLSVIADDIAAGMPPETAQQEYYCSFTSVNVGVVYAREMAAAQRDGRIGQIAFDARYPVETWWDIGHRDATAIWFSQRRHNKINFIDYLEDRGKGLPHYAAEIAKKNYPINRHVGPHDLENKIWALDATAQTIARNFGIHFTVAPKLPIADGILAARTMFSRCTFDAGRCAQGLAAFDQYQYEWDEDIKSFTDKPIHDWSSHPADAFRYGAVTPEGAGIVPAWAAEMMAGQGMPPGMGHNGGPPLKHEPYDPLAAFRSRR